MKKTGILLILSLLLLLPPCGLLQAQKLNGNYPAEKLSERILRIAAESGKTIAFDMSNLEKLTVPALEFGSNGVEDLLELSLKGTSFTYRKLSGNAWVIAPKDGIKPGAEPIKGKGTLSGRVTDEQGGPVTGATVGVAGTTLGTLTDIDGKYRLQSVQAGTVTLRFSFISYETLEVKDVKINPDKITTLDVVMKQSTEELNEVVITASYKQASAEGLYAKQKAMVAMTNGISADQIKKTGDNNLGQVLKRVNGLTVQDNKFVTIRGMSDRYNNVQLNGALLPSTEPNRRNFSFDIIPSNLVDNIVVVKTFSPDLPGEFAGGIVQVNTLDIPKEKFLSISAGTGINTNSTGKEFRSTKRFTSDYFGGGNDRTWLNTKFDVQGFSNVYTPGNTTDEAFAQMAAYNTKIPNTWGLYKFTAQPMQSYAVSGGRPFKLGNGQQLGIIAAATYRHEESVEDYDAIFRNNVSDSTRNAKKYAFTTTLGGVANVAWEKTGHKIVWRNLVNRRFSLTTNEMDKATENEGTMIYEYYSSTLINTLWQTRLEGEHLFWSNHIKFNWFADQNHLERKQPDDRYSKGTYHSSDVNRILSYSFQGSPADGGFLMAALYEETKKNIGGNLEFSINVAGREQKIRTGYMGTFRDASSDMLGLKIFQRENTTSYMGMPDYMIYTPENFQNNLYYNFAYSKTSNDPGSSAASQYKGNQDIHGYYAMADISPFKMLRLIGGYRLEKTTMEVHTSTRILEPELHWVDSTVAYPAEDWLPAATVILNITPKVSVRMAYSKTITRPEFRERSAYIYYDVNERATLKGNGGLVQSYSENYDFRIEWYPAPGEVISAGAFYKEFTKPVEMVAFETQSNGFSLFYFNLDKATTRGIEFDIRKSLGFIVPDFAFLKNIYISGNATVMEGNVTYNAEKLLQEAIGKSTGLENVDAKRSRQLQGLAPYVVNAGFSYLGKNAGVNLSYNRAGNIMVLAGTNVENDEYEQGRDVIDLQVSYRLMKEKMEIKFNVSDMLAQPYVRFRNCNPKDLNLKAPDDPEGTDYNAGWDWTLRNAQRGDGFSLSVSYKF